MPEKKTSKKSSKTKKTPSKKNSKKNSKKTPSKKKREPKLKVFCGVTQPIPKGFRLGSMQECLDKKQIRYYGIKKVDSRLLQSVETKETETELAVKIAGLKGKMNRIQREIKNVKTADEKKKMIEDYDTAKKELIIVAEKLKALKEKK